MPFISTAILGRTGLEVSRLGLGTLSLSADQYRAAFEAGVNYVLTYHGAKGEPERTVAQAVKGMREKVIIGDGADDRTRDGLLRSLDRSLATLETGRIDLFHLFYVVDDEDWEHILRPGGALEGVRKAQAEGTIRFVAVSIHNRPLAGKIAASGEIDVMMVRYNCAHPGAEKDIFPYARNQNCGVIAYNALKWQQLLRRPAGWPQEEKVPAASDCYRFVLSHPAVHSVLIGARTFAEIEADIRTLSPFSPITPEEDSWLRAFGKAAHG